jgi:hypothetical protein
MVRYVLTLSLLGGLLGSVPVGRAQEKPPAPKPHRVEQLDEASRSVAVEVTMVEVALKKGENGQEAAEPDFAGSPEKVAAKVEELRKSGQVSHYQRLRFTALEGQPVTVTAGGNRPIVTASTVRAAGRDRTGNPFPVQRSITYQQAGTNVRATARVATNNAVVLDLNVTDSRVKPPEGEKEVGAAIDNAALTTKVRVPAGRAVVAQSLRSDGKAGRTISLVIVSARVVEPGGK